jgi:hypothetical protein
MRVLIVSLLIVLLAVFKVNAQGHSADTVKAGKSFITTSVKINGLVENELSLTVADLKQMKTTRVDNFDVIGKGGVVKSHLASFNGVLLKDVLASASVKVAALKESGRLYIVVAAADGFKVVFFWAELFNTSLGDHVFVAFEENGKSIEKEGNIVLFSTNDKINGIRHVKWLKDITVKKAD